MQVEKLPKDNKWFVGSLEIYVTSKGVLASVKTSVDFPYLDVTLNYLYAQNEKLISNMIESDLGELDKSY